jgi:hypothetical protein
MPNVSLSSFMKILSQGAPQKIREYGKYLTPGGYDFYWRLKDAAYALTVGGQPFDKCLQSINQIKSDVERRHNHQGFEALNKWVSGQGYSFFAPPKGSCSSPKGYLTVKLEPEFGMESGGHRRIVHIWNCKGTDLKQMTAGVGIYLMQKYLAVGAYGDCSCAILDLRKGRMFLAVKISTQIPLIVSSEFAWVDNFFTQLEEAA